MDKYKDFSMFISYGHVLYCFFLCCLFPFEGIRKNGKIKHGKISHSTEVGHKSSL